MPTKKVLVDSVDTDGEVVRDKSGQAVKVDTGRTYEIDGKKFTWHPLDEDDALGNVPDVTLPMRIKLGLIRSMAGMELDNITAMFDMLEAVAPGQDDVLDEMDINDFQLMFTTWQGEYNALTGATPGE